MGAALAALWKRSLQESGEVKAGRPQKGGEIATIFDKARDIAGDMFSVGGKAVDEAEEILEKAPDLWVEKHKAHWTAMREDGMPYQAIAELAGVSDQTVRRAVSTNVETQTVVGKDGKTYPARKPRRTPAIKAKDSREEKSALQM